MRLQSLETFIVANPPPSYGGRYFIFIKLTTDDGITGVGEAYTATVSPEVVVQMLEDTFERYFQDQAIAIESLWRRVYSSGFSQRPDISMGGIISALEMACWDILGKAANMPVYQMLGGQVHERLRSYTYLYPSADDTEERVYSDPDLAAERALHYVEQGFTAVKFDPAGMYTAFDPHEPSLSDLERSEQFAAKVREAIGTRADILFGTHGQFTPSGALRMARRLEAYDPLWFEEPVPPDMPEQMAKVAQGTCIPIATGERLTSKYEFARVLAHGAASIMQMNLGRVGGLLEAKKIAGMAEAHHATIAPHLYCGPIVGAANIQLATCSPNLLIIEGIEQWGGIYADLLQKPIQWQDGYVIPPQAPGLGVELNEGKCRALRWTGKELHLQMAPEPHSVSPQRDVAKG